VSVDSAWEQKKLEARKKPEKVTEGKLGIKIKLDKISLFTPANKKVLEIFLENVSPDWISRSKWLDDAIPKLTADPKTPVYATRGNIVYELSVDKNNFLNLLVKPKPKPNAKEF